MNPDGHYILEEGKTLGPLTLDQLKWMWKLGTVNAETPYWREGLSVWISLGRSVESAIQEDEWRAAQAVPPPLPAAPAPGASHLSAKAVALIVGAIVLLIGIGVYAGLNAEPSSQPQANASRPTAHAPAVATGPTNSAWDGSVPEVRIWIKKNAKDPRSVEFIEWSPVVRDGQNFLVRVKYRAKNSFGGYVIEEMVVVMDPTGKVVSAVPSGT